MKHQRQRRFKEFKLKLNLQDLSLLSKYLNIKKIYNYKGGTHFEISDPHLFGINSP